MTRILGLDFGTRRVGAAISDPGRTIASPLEVYERKDVARDARHYAHLVAANEVGRIVVGLPVHTSGQEGELATKARSWGDWLGGVTGLPVVFHDERFSSLEADEVLMGSGFKRQKRKGLRDMLAARLVLQAYLDAGSPEVGRPPLPLADEEGCDP